MVTSFRPVAIVTQPAKCCPRCNQCNAWRSARDKRRKLAAASGPGAARANSDPLAADGLPKLEKPALRRRGCGGRGAELLLSRLQERFHRRRYVVGDGSAKPLRAGLAGEPLERLAGAIRLGLRRKPSHV